MLNNEIINLYKYNYKIKILLYLLGIGDWGLGIGDWGLGFKIFKKRH